MADPTYTLVEQDAIIPIGTDTYLHFISESAVMDLILVKAIVADKCYCAEVLAGEDLFLGPFDVPTFSNALTLHHFAPDDVYMAVFSAPIMNPAQPESAQLTLLGSRLGLRKYIDVTYQYVEVINRNEVYIERINLSEDG